MFISFSLYRLFKIDVHIISRYIPSCIPRSYVKYSFLGCNYVIYIIWRQREIIVQYDQILGYMLRFFWFFITNFTITVRLKDVAAQVDAEKK